ncbi:hypothetical protein HA466_0285400 [Hirschfeldia incana]|nr:hypothetical protein HA466_0285400 [Hirschfeldia incana]
MPIHFLSPKTSCITPPLSSMKLQRCIINPPFKKAIDPPQIRPRLCARSNLTPPILTGEAPAPLLFRHVSPGPGESTLRFRLIHYWEASKIVKGGPSILLGIELLMIDEEN